MFTTIYYLSKKGDHLYTRHLLLLLLLLLLLVILLLLIIMIIMIMLITIITVVQNQAPTIMVKEMFTARSLLAGGATGSCLRKGT